MASLFLRTLVLSTLVFSVAADSDSDADDSDLNDKPPAIAPAAVALALFGFSGLVHLIQFFRFGWPKPFMLTLIIGMAMMIGGFVTRILSANPATKEGNNVATIALILLAPCLFLGLNYMILGRLVAIFGSEVASKTMFIAPTRVATIFVCSDITTFLIQAVGGALLASKTVKTNILGTHLLLVGLCLQLVSFALFTALTIVFGNRMRKHFPQLWHATGRSNFAPLNRDLVGDWKILYYTLCVTCAALLLRSTFRVVEFATGFHSYLSTQEVFFYCLDALPVWTAMTLYCVVWPPRFLSPYYQGVSMEALELPKHQSPNAEEETILEA
ncbi:RTA1 like protein-domain-containing protein [Mycena epipterygia]|nr:RTA1 like protein-domain-containing protein [Mycena epipterygia]